MPILLIFPQFLLRNYFILSVAATAIPYRTALASITLKAASAPYIYLIYNILRRVLKFWFTHTRFIWIICLKSMQI